ncbi:MAG: DUF6893 family small protein [Thermomicrobiales bacterium]
MLRRFIVGSILIAIASVIVQSLPDVARYLKMREM